MENRQNYRIADFERVLPAGARFDEVVYQSKGGLRVKYVHGVVNNDIEGDVYVTWDFLGKCYRRNNWVRMPEWDLKLETSEGKRT